MKKIRGRLPPITQVILRKLEVSDFSKGEDPLPF
jgi:hypothetical protein